MKLFAFCSVAALSLFVPALVSAQTTGRIECARYDGYVYLYSSTATMEVRATLPCGAVVQVTSRFDNYFGVRTAKGDTGFVPLASIVLLKDQSNPASSSPSPEPPSRERMHYDEPLRQAFAPAHPAPPAFTLLKDTPVRVKLLKTISSGTAHVGDPVEFEILDDLFVDGILVLSKGAKASGTVADADPKRRFGHGGKVAFTLTTIHLSDGELVPVRCYESASGLSNTSGDAVLPLASGKDVALLQDAEFTALIDGDFRPKREAFATLKDNSAIPPASPVQTPQPH